MLFHRAGVLTDSQEECSARAFLSTNLHRHRVLTSKVRRTQQSKTESRQHRNSFLAYSGATATPSQPLQKPAPKWVSWAWEMGQTILADVFLRHISIWNRNVWMDVAQEHTCAPFYLYYLLSVFTQLLDIISLFYWQWFFFNRPF